MAYKGRYTPKNPRKYRGDPSNVIYRSLWERKLMIYLDDHPNVIMWSSEEFCIPYKNPIDGKIRRYFPDFWVKKKNKDGNVETVVIEVKPKAQTRPPLMENKYTAKGRLSTRWLNQVKTYGMNEAKWKAANNFCKDRNWKFQIMTEKELGI